MMLPFSFFQSASSLDSFLSTYGSEGDRRRWIEARQKIQLNEKQLATVNQFRRRMNILVLAGAWCSDCSIQCAALLKFAEVCSLLQLRFLDRDAHPTAQAELQINGGNRVPVVVFFSEDGFEVARCGDRVLATYRRLGAGADPHDLNLSNPNYAEELTGDWLRELERVEWILRLSPRLKRLHQD